MIAGSKTPPPAQPDHRTGVAGRELTSAWEHRQGSLPAPARRICNREVFPWRRVLFRLGYIGEGREAFGNVSVRFPGGFLITAAGTSGWPEIGMEAMTLVLEPGFPTQRIVSRGRLKPSSESLAHAALYRALPAAGAVVHAHHPGLWEAAGRLGIPVSAPEAGPGTPELAREMDRLARAADSPQLLLAMGGHRDGVISAGADLAAAVEALIRAVCAAEGLSAP